MSDEFPDKKFFDGHLFRKIYEGSVENAQKMAAKCRLKGKIYVRVVKGEGHKGKRAGHAVYARID